MGGGCHLPVAVGAPAGGPADCTADAHGQAHLHRYRYEDADVNAFTHAHSEQYARAYAAADRHTSADRHAHAQPHVQPDHHRHPGADSRAHQYPPAHATADPPAGQHACAPAHQHTSPPFSGAIVRRDARCDGYRGVEGYVRHGNGSGYGGVAVGIWSDAWWGIVTLSEADGKYAFNLMGLPPGKFRIAVVRYETCAVQGELRTAKDCQRQSGIVEITITENCTGEGATQVVWIDFTGP